LSQIAKVLVVDDESAVRDLSLRALTRVGFECQFASNGEEAMHVLRSTQFDVVVTDLRTRLWHGYALAMDLVRGTNRPLVIVLTDVLEPRIAKNLIDHGVDDILFEPIDYDVFAAKIESLVKKYRSEATAAIQDSADSDHMRDHTKPARMAPSVPAVLHRTSVSPITDKSSDTPSRGTRRAFALAASIATSITLLISVLILVDWAFQERGLASLLPSGTPTSPTIAFALIALSMSLLLQRDRKRRTGNVVGKCLALGVTALAVFILATYVLGQRWFVDQLVFTGTLGENRVASNTALCLGVVGLAMSLIDVKSLHTFRISEVFAICGAAISLLCIVGYAYGSQSLYGVSSFISMVPPSALATHLLALGILFSRPGAGIMATITHNALGGIMARRLIPAVVVLLVGLGWLRLQGELLGYYDTEFGVAIYAVVGGSGMAAAVWWCARALNELDMERLTAADSLRQLNEELESRVKRRTAELMAMNQHLLQKNEENELFVYSVSHDLRSPLVNLHGFSQELASGCDEIRSLWQNHSGQVDASERLAQILDEEIAPSIKFIQSGVGRLSAIIDALLRLSRAGRVEYRPEIVDTNVIVGRVVDSLRGTIVERGAKIHIEDLPSAWGDATALEQVFGNLISNALNYLDPTRPGIIHIGSCLRADSPRGQHIFVVRDNGLGIAPQHQAKVFQAFQRLHADRAVGEGIGLTMTQRIVERHAGHIWFESREGTGTEFFVSLPAQQPKQVNTARTQKNEPSHVTSTAGHVISRER
jgi:signal transduction histidine kinase/CheY-like chemotaxis protein